MNSKNSNSKEIDVRFDGFTEQLKEIFNLIENNKFGQAKRITKQLLKSDQNATDLNIAFFLCSFKINFEQIEDKYLWYYKYTNSDLYKKIKDFAPTELSEKLDNHFARAKEKFDNTFIGKFNNFLESHSGFLINSVPSISTLKILFFIAIVFSIIYVAMFYESFLEIRTIKVRHSRITIENFSDELKIIICGVFTIVNSYMILILICTVANIFKYIFKKLKSHL